MPWRMHCDMSAFWQQQALFLLQKFPRITPRASANATMPAMNSLESFIDYSLVK